MCNANNNEPISSDQSVLKRIKKRAEQFWAASKYDVMARGYASYKQISARYRDASTTTDYEAAIYSISHTLNVLPYTKKGLRTSIEHMWGYVSKHVHEEERSLFQRTFEAVDWQSETSEQEAFEAVDWQSETSEQEAFEAAVPLLSLIQELAAKYDVAYIKQTMANSFTRLTRLAEQHQQDHSEEQ
ncbi:DUF1722 domain-containing protein [Paenibacillus assamensis]|uniref:DUF1722 domain-containing protein n=1 Tax=Paenibacillus assamensis TaxID=311244 RepID=UPI000412119F|nr:DUF1722 domain-containing protein [Paenibacillus assamensis]